MADPLTITAIQFAVGIAFSILSLLLAPDVKNKGPRLDDLSPTGVQPGAPIPRAKSCIAVPGQVIAQTELIETKNKEEVGGKGGPSVTNTTFTYRVHCAVAFSQGVIGTITRIKANEKVIYERPSPQTLAEIEDEIAALQAQEEADAAALLGSTDPANPNQTGWTDPSGASFATTTGSLRRRAELEAEAQDTTGFYSAIEIFTGTTTQGPSSILEGLEGVGKVPAYRETAYFALRDFQLAEFGNRMPVFKIETADVGGTEGANVLTGPEPTDDIEPEWYIIDHDRNRIYAMELGGNYNPVITMREFNLSTLTEIKVHTLTGNITGAARLMGLDPVTGYLLGCHGYNPPGPETYNVEAYAYDPVSETFPVDVNFAQAAFEQMPSDFDVQHYPVIQSPNGSHRYMISTDFSSDVPSLNRNNIHRVTDFAYIGRFTGPEEGVYEGVPSRPKWMTGAPNVIRGDDTCWLLWMSFDNIQFRKLTLGNDGVVTQTNYASHHRTVFDGSRIFQKLGLTQSVYIDEVSGDLICTITMGTNPDFKHYAFRWKPSTDAFLWISEIPFQETTTTNRGNTRVAGDQLVIYGDSFAGVERININTGEVVTELSEFGFDINLQSTSYDDYSGCLFTTAPGTSFDPFRRYCFVIGVTCGISVANLIRDLLTNWANDVSPLVEGDHFTIDPALETMIVNGGAWTRPQSIIEALDLIVVWKPIAYFESNGQIKFIPRDKPLDAVIPAIDLRYHAADEVSEAAIVGQRTDDIGLPAEVRVKFSDFNRLYSANTAYARVKNRRSYEVTEIEVPFSGTPEEAKESAHTVIAEAYAGRVTREIGLPMPYFIVEQWDVLDVPDNDGILIRTRVKEIEFGANFVLRMKLADHVETFDTVFTSETGILNPSLLVRPLPAIMVALDTHRLTDDPVSDDGFQIVIGAAGVDANYPGASIYRDRLSGGVPGFGTDFGDPAETNFERLGDFLISVDRGTVLQPPSGTVDEFTVDRTLSMLVEFQTFGTEFLTLTDAQFETTFRNVMLVGDNVKGWEIVQAQNAVHLTDDIVEFWTLRRGMRGTEWAIPLLALGDEVVALTLAAFDRDPYPPAVIGETLTYRAATIGTDVVAAEDYDLVVVGRQNILYAPMLGEVFRDGAGEVTGTVQGRTLQADANGQFILATADQDFDIVILNGDPSGSPAPGVVRTISLTDTDAFVYTVANQTTDFGSPQAAYFATIYQKDSAGTRGYGRNVIL